MSSQPTDRVCTVQAPAKLNLCLELLGKRADGFHELRTVMASVRLFDTVRVTSTHDPAATSLTVFGSRSAGVPVDRSNLVLRAIELLRAAAGIDRGIRAQLVKRIPNQAGLGGGSSDAAAALVAADRVWDLGWSIERLAELAAQLGSDIPYFIHRLRQPRAWAALASGRGERIDTFTPPSGIPAVIVKPAFGLSTAEVYGATVAEDHAALRQPPGCETTAAALQTGRWRELARGMRNHLQAAADRVSQELGPLRDAFDLCGFEVHQLSGSGSAYYGLAGSFREATRLAARLRALRVGQVYTTVIG